MTSLLRCIQKKLRSSIKSVNSFAALKDEVRSEIVLGLLSESGQSLLSGLSAALREQASAGNLTAVEWLLSVGVRPSWDDSMALECAAEAGELECVRALLACGANPNHRRGSEHSGALRWAVQNGHVECAKLLLASGARPDEGGSRPLIMAATNGHEACVRLLVDAGAQINHQDHSIMADVARSAANTQSLQYLMAAGADPKSAAMVLAEDDDVEAICRLFSVGADLKKVGIVAAKIMARRGNVSGIDTLVKMGCDITSDALVILCTAALAGRYEVVKYLLENFTLAKADIARALRFAAKSGYRKSMGVLIENGADATDRGCMVLRWYEVYGDDDFMDYLASKTFGPTAKAGNWRKFAKLKKKGVRRSIRTPIPQQVTAMRLAA